MANVASAQKRNRQRLKRRDRNVFHLSTLRTQVKKVQKALLANDKKAAEAALQIAVKAIDKAAQKGVIKKETASRKVSRLTLAVNRGGVAAAAK